MKFAAVAVALLSTTSAISVDQQAGSYEQALSSIHDPADQKNVEAGKLAQVVTQALAGAPPGEITMPLKSAANDIENDVQMTKGKTINYEYFWKYACAWTRWVPTNQFLHCHEQKDPECLYDKTKMTLERFGFIGMNKKCFWGMVGVKWITPLKVDQKNPEDCKWEKQ